MVFPTHCISPKDSWSQRKAAILLYWFLPCLEWSQFCGTDGSQEGFRTEISVRRHLWSAVLSFPGAAAGALKTHQGAPLRCCGTSLSACRSIPAPESRTSAQWICSGDGMAMRGGLPHPKRGGGPSRQSVC